MHQNSIDIMGRLIETHLCQQDQLNILDLGSAIVSNQHRFGSYKQFMAPNWSYTGADIESGYNVDVVLEDGYNWQFEDNSFDVVISGQTLEHLEYPWVWMTELARVLKPGGKCIIIAPAVIHEHKYPIDTFRYYPDGMKALAKWAKLDIIEVGMKQDGKLTDTYLVACKQQ